MLVAISIATPVFAQTALPGYQPINSRHRIVTKTQQSQVMQGQSVDTEASVEQLASVAIVKDGAGLALTMTVDSMTASSNGGAPAPDVNAIKALKFVGVMDVDGRVTSSKVTDKAGNPSDSPAAAGVRSFLPRLKVGATPGTKWYDTVTTTRPQSGGTVSTVVTTTYTLVGDTTVAGAKNWRVAAVSTGTVSGTGNQGGADYTIKGSIDGAGTILIGAGGALTLAELTNDSKMIVDVPLAGMQIPVTQKTTTTITRVP
jgi:hypothetical protein